MGCEPLHKTVPQPSGKARRKRDRHCIVSIFGCYSDGVERNPQRQPLIEAPFLLDLIPEVLQG